MLIWMTRKYETLYIYRLFSIYEAHCTVYIIRCCVCVCVIFRSYDRILIYTFVHGWEFFFAIHSLVVVTLENNTQSFSRTSTFRLLNYKSSEVLSNALNRHPTFSEAVKDPDGLSGSPNRVIGNKQGTEGSGKNSKKLLSLFRAMHWVLKGRWSLGQGPNRETEWEWRWTLARESITR